MSGIPLYEALPARPGVFLPTLGWQEPTHIARTAPEDEAREAVIGRARKLVRLADPSADDISALARDIAALDALDAS